MTRSKASKTTPVRKTKASARPIPKKTLKTPRRAVSRISPRRAGAAAAKPVAGRLPAIGAPFQGGFYAGKFFGADGKPYALIVAPKAGGETECAFKTERSADPGARSLRDGLANSEAMNDAAHPAAKFCRALAIGGFRDWYLPSRHEAALLAETLMPGGGYVPEQTTAEAFREGGPEAFSRAWYWTSTEWSAGYAWYQDFDGGTQGYDGKDWSSRVRAVRKCPL